MANEHGVGRGQEAIASDKRLEAFHLRCKGKTYREIAAALGVNHQTAHNYVKEILEENHAQTLELGRKYVELELKRLDGMYESIEKKAIEGDLAAQEMVIKIMARRTKYLGLDAPDKIEHSGTVSIASEIKKRRDAANNPVIEEIYAAKEPDSEEK